jgi:hypothetical protein
VSAVPQAGGLDLEIHFGDWDGLGVPADEMPGVENGLLGERELELRLERHQDGALGFA